jgi:REP element-mobilizing transposase RayT
MAGTFSQIYIHLVFAVQNRESMIQLSWEEELYKYITGIVQNKKQKMLAINGMPDHVHLFLNVRPSCCIADLVREIKKSTNEWVAEKHFTSCKFKWQEGYGAFSHGHGSVSSVISYVMNQKEHHRHKTFQEEYLGFLEKFDIPHQDEYLFRWIR